VSGCFKGMSRVWVGRRGGGRMEVRGEGRFEEEEGRLDVGESGERMEEKGSVTSSSGRRNRQKAERRQGHTR
jgi:hypothetical protein